MIDSLLSMSLSVAAVLILAAVLSLNRRQLGQHEARLTQLEQQCAHAAQANAEVAAQLGDARAELKTLAADEGLLQSRQADLAARVEVLETQTLSDQPYGDAIRLVRQGARESRLVDELGLNPVEAALIVRLHGAAAH
jgi:septal ring factor EnvC (AmiA/AmiB activator)